MNKYDNARLIITSEKSMSEKLENDDITGFLGVDTESGIAFFNGGGYYIIFESLVGIVIEEQNNTSFINLFEENGDIWVFENVLEVE